MVASWIAGGALLLAMVAASARGAVRLPADARIPVHYGSPERCYLASKRAGLLIWPAIGAVLFGALGGVAWSSLASDWVPGIRATLAPAAVVVALGFQVGALVLARRGGIGAGAGGAGAGGAGAGGAGAGGAGAGGAGRAARGQGRGRRAGGGA